MISCHNMCGHHQIPTKQLLHAGFLLGSRHMLFIPAGLAVSIGLTSSGFVLQTMGLKVQSCSDRYRLTSEAAHGYDTEFETAYCSTCRQAPLPQLRHADVITCTPA